MFLAFKNGVNSIQTAGYNSARTVVVVTQLSSSFLQFRVITEAPEVGG